MTNERNDPSAATVLDSIRGTRDALSVRRVFGDPQEIDGITIIPVARVAGGAGGGGGEGTREQDAGSGFGTGFGLHAQPLGIYRIHDGQVDWQPIIDVNRLARGGQILAGVAMVCLTIFTIRRFRAA